MKRDCSRCGVSYPLEYYSNRYTFCRACVSARDAVRGPRCNSRDPKRNETEAARARKRRWQSANYDPVKAAARRAIKEALTSGGMKRPDKCERCGNSARRRDGVSAVQAHHDDYTKPLDVRWLCPPCHSAVHDAARTEEESDE